MCDCIKNLEKDLVGKIIGRKKVIKAKIDSSFIMIGSGYQTHSDIELELEGQKKKIIKPYAHKFCPVCGIKYPEDKSWQTIRP